MKGRREKKHREKLRNEPEPKGMLTFADGRKKSGKTKTGSWQRNMASGGNSWPGDSKLRF
jgi:hypothetical protein